VTVERAHVALDSVPVDVDALAPNAAGLTLQCLPLKANCRRRLYHHAIAERACSELIPPTRTPPIETPAGTIAGRFALGAAAPDAIPAKSTNSKNRFTCRILGGLHSKCRLGP
jgi:hypothetical protein